MIEYDERPVGVLVKASKSVPRRTCTTCGRPYHRGVGGGGRCGICLSGGALAPTTDAKPAKPTICIDCHTNTKTGTLLYDRCPECVEKWRAQLTPMARPKGGKSKRTPTRRPVSPPWSKGEEMILRDMAGRASFEEIAAAIVAQGWPQRTGPAVEFRMRQIGLSTMAVGFGLSELAAVLGVGLVRVQRWITDGKLDSRPISTRKSAGLITHRAISQEAVEAFLAQYPDLYDWQAISQANARSRALSDVARRAALRARPDRRWLTVKEVQARLRICNTTAEALARDGVVAAEKRYAGSPQPQWFLDAEEVEAFARRRLEQPRFRAVKTRTHRATLEQCANGHPWTQESLYVEPRGHMVCRICREIHRRTPRGAR